MSCVKSYSYLGPIYLSFLSRVGIKCFFTNPYVTRHLSIHTLYTVKLFVHLGRVQRKDFFFIIQ